MKNWWRILASFGLWLNSLHAEYADSSIVEKNFSVGLHGFESLIGNYGFTASFRLSRHVSLSVPVEFYSFTHSLPGNLALRFAQNFTTSHNFGNPPALSMFHLRAGLGTRFFFTPSALASGFYLEPIIYGGLIRTSNFTNVEFDNKQEVVDSVVNAVYRPLPTSDHVAVTPQLNIGYQWVSDLGLLLQVALYGNYVYAPSVNSVFNASDRFFASTTINKNIKSRVSQSAIDIYRVLGTQMHGWHGGLVLDLGIAF